MKLKACVTTGYAQFHCPGCKSIHAVAVEPARNSWGYNENADAPTLTPSVLVRSGHYVGDGENCWCTFNAARPDETPDFICEQCHSFVTDGRIQFLPDCSHELAGQTVDLPDWIDV